MRSLSERCLAGKANLIWKDVPLLGYASSPIGPGNWDKHRAFDQYRWIRKVSDLFCSPWRSPSELNVNRANNKGNNCTASERKVKGSPQYIRNFSLPQKPHSKLSVARTVALSKNHSLTCTLFSLSLTRSAGICPNQKNSSIYRKVPSLALLRKVRKSCGKF